MAAVMGKVEYFFQEKLDASWLEMFLGKIGTWFFLPAKQGLYLVMKVYE